MDDLALARKRYHAGGVSLVAVRHGELLGSSSEGGVRPLLQLVLRLGEGLRGAALADKVVGRAAALLCHQVGIAAVYTPLASEGALQELDAAGIRAEADATTARILNRVGDDLCPFEKLTDGRSPAEALAALRAFFRL